MPRAESVKDDSAPNPAAAGFPSRSLTAAASPFSPEAEGAFRRLLKASPVGLAITTFDEGRYLEVSESESLLTGYKQEELIGRRALDFGFYDDPEDSREIRRRLLGEGTLTNYPFRFRRKTGELRWGLMSASLFEFEGRNCILSTVTDVTDLRTMERAHKLNEARVLLASESATIGWWEWEITSGVVRCNDSYYTMLGYAPQEFPVTYETWKELLHPEERATAAAVVEEMLSGSRDAFDVEGRLRRRDGSYHWVRGIGRVFAKSVEGVPLQAFGLHVDIHERKSSEERLRRFNEELDRLVRERTAELERSNAELRRETEARRTAEAELRALTEELARINNALHVVLRKSREESACGALLALASRERRFDEEELSLMGFLSGLAASEEGRRRAEAAAQRLAALEAAIAAVDAARREATSREDYLERCLRALPGVLGADGAFFLAEHAGARAPLEIRFFPPQPGERPTPVTINSTLEETLHRSPENRRLAPGEPVILEAKATLPRPLFARRGVKAWVLSPLGRNGRVSGLLGLELRGRKARFEPCWARVAAAAAGLLGLGLEEIAFREGIASLRQAVREVVEILDSEHAKDPAAEASPPAGEPMLLEIERSLRRLAESVRGKRRFAYRDLTPTEIRVANLIREGRSSKEVAERLGLSPRTVHTHRYNIRKKLNLCGGSKTLRAHLCAME